MFSFFTDFFFLNLNGTSSTESTAVGYQSGMNPNVELYYIIRRKKRGRGEGEGGASTRGHAYHIWMLMLSVR